MRIASRALGILGEDLAVSYLLAEGYQILWRNFRCRLGEVDVVAADSGVLVFVEVKTRQSLGAGEPAESVTAFKRHQIIKAAQWYLKSVRLEEALCRFDVVSVFLGEGRVPEIQLIRDAFGER